MQMETKAKLYHGVWNESFDPQDYVWVDSVDLGGRFPSEEEIRRRVMWAEKIGAHSKTSLGINRCSHCGANLRYAHILRHEPTGDFLSVGSDCIERFNHETRQAVLLAHTALRYAAADGRRRLKADAFREDNPGLVEGLTEILAHINDNFARSLLTQFEDKSSLSPKQIAAGYRVIERGKARILANEAITLAGQQAPEGRRRVRGLVKTVRPAVCEEEISKCSLLVEDAVPYRVWLTIPKCVEADLDVGDTLEVTLTLSAAVNKPDPLFRFGSRPHGAKIVCKTAETSL